MEVKKMSIEGLEGKNLEFATQFNAFVDALEAKSIEVKSLNDKVADLEKLEVKNYDSQVLELKNAIKAIEDSAPKGETKELSLVDQIVKEIKGLGVNNVQGLYDYLNKNGKKEFEIKAISAVASTGNTDTVGRTNLNMTVNWTPAVRAAFLPYFRTVAEASNKSKFGYVEGSYTGAAAYVGEGTGNGNSDSASASAAFMDYAKVQAVLSVNTEVYEDIPDFAQGLVNQMQIAMQKFVDDQAYTGDGAVHTGVQYIKGLKTYAKEAEFISGKNMAAYASSVKSANTADLIAAIKTYIDNLDGSYMADVVYMNPVDLFKMNRLKDTTGQPIINKDFQGNPTIAGLVIRTSSKITANTLLVMDSAVCEWRTKRSMKLQMGQILANDVLNDKQSAILSARYQLLVRTLDQNAIVKVSDISAAVDAIDIQS